MTKMNEMKREELDQVAGGAQNGKQDSDKVTIRVTNNVQNNTGTTTGGKTVVIENGQEVNININ